MDASVVFRKTGKGMAELEQDVRRLGTQVRQLLLLIDGNRTVGDLGLLMPTLGDVRPTLRDLLFEGLITTNSPQAMAEPERPAAADGEELFPYLEDVLTGGEGRSAAASAPAPTPPPTPTPPPVAATPAPPPASAPAAAAASAPEAASKASAERIKNLQSRMMGEVRDFFGRDADLISPKVRACKSVAELTMLASRLRSVADSYGGAAEADRFLETLMTILAEGSD
ncbi:MAG: hypothetical protein AAF604_15710 [Acidobacteriota bacterium]